MKIIATGFNANVGAVCRKRFLLTRGGGARALPRFTRGGIGFKRGGRKFRKTPHTFNTKTGLLRGGNIRAGRGDSVRRSICCIFILRSRALVRHKNVVVTVRARGWRFARAYNGGKLCVQRFIFLLGHCNLLLHGALNAAFNSPGLLLIRLLSKFAKTRHH